MPEDCHRGRSPQAVGTIEVLDDHEQVFATGRFATDSAGYAAMRKHVATWPERTWAVEGGNGAGRPLAQRLLADGEHVVDVPAKLVARVRMLDTGHGRKPDAHDAHSVAVAAVRAKELRVLALDPELEAVRMLSIAAPSSPGNAPRQPTDSNACSPNSAGQASTKYPGLVVRRLGLSGHQLDLDDLLEAFGDGDPAVVKIDDAYFLVSQEFEASGDDHVGLMSKAQEILTQMHGAVRLENSQHRAVRLDGSIHDSDGRKHAVVVADVAEVRSRVSPVTIVVDGAPVPTPKSLARSGLEAAGRNDSAKSVLRLLGQGPLDWVNLYRVLDYVANAVGGKAKIVQVGLATNVEMDRFGASANRPEVSGDEARHGPMAGTPPTRTMTLGEGRAFILRVVGEWLKTI